MCLAGQMPAAPASTADAVAMVRAGLGWLATTDVASLPAVEQAECLRGLERAASMHLAARWRCAIAGARHRDRGQPRREQDPAQPRATARRGCLIAVRSPGTPGAAFLRDAVFPGLTP